MKQLPKKREKSVVRLFSKRARSFVIGICALCFVALVLIPMELNRIGNVNSVAAAARAEVPATVPQTTPEAIELLQSASASPTPMPSDGAHISQYSLLQENDDYEFVRVLQLRLMELGYLDSDEPTTHYGSATKNAIALFQRTLSYDMNGVADIPLQESLFSVDAASYEMKIGDTGADVQRMQAQLSELGYYEDKINGFFGTATEDAVRAFQRKNGLSADGVIHVDDRDLLYSPEARPKIDPTPTPSPTPRPTPRPTTRPTAKPTDAPITNPTERPTNVPANPPSVTPSSSTDAPSATDAPDTPVEPTAAPTEAPTAVPDPTATPKPATGSSDVDGLISVAKSLLGSKYVYSTEGPNTFDCSGFVYYCLRSIGIRTSRYSASGFSKVSSWTTISNKGDLQRGDLIFFYDMNNSSRIGHTGIFLGDGEYIHASSSSGKVVISSASASYFRNYFSWGKRVF